MPWHRIQSNQGDAVEEVPDDDPAARPARNLDARPYRRFSGPARRRAIRGRPVKPDLQAPLGCGFLRAAPQAARPAFAERSRGRPRISGHARAFRHRGAGAQGLRTVRRRHGHRQRVLRDGISRRPHLLGPTPSRPLSRRAPGDVPIDERGHRRIAFGRPRQGRARRVRPAGQLHGASDRALEPAVPGIGDREATGDGPAHRMAASATCRPKASRASCTATTASTIWSFTRPSPG